MACYTSIESSGEITKYVSRVNVDGKVPLFFVKLSQTGSLFMIS